MEKELEVEATTEPEEHPKKVAKLDGDDALLLWLKGKDVWNKWMEQNPKAEVSFEGVKFNYAWLKNQLVDQEHIKSQL
ncbi:hypothetical protein [Pseudoalteromonas luteoviolacea]|uniref:Uncharacterized protein n=1 Tax=Pseudoalteromonas luteoviolacea H33 TaxID=1365251 RepID=A0A167E1K5_9GAMM|nr:hypothetical protein [Pseudoalteromonas luteoviolacea]KZN49885.1 hypothetical protein N476_17930 [Pseudoalteromonas luteoviolacea H33]KZN74799.1 hypothetical protein N477_21345 [Pseudoalteromonas luteoviolacea H33-S]